MKNNKFLNEHTIKITDFAERHFKPDFSGTKILNMSIKEVEDIMNNLNNLKYYYDDQIDDFNSYKILDGYAPFCKLLFIKNFTDAKVGTLKITIDNYQYLRSGYKSRTDSELPILSRWFELPLKTPTAEWLVFVLYSKEQIDKEALINYDNSDNDSILKEFDAEWGVVSIMGQNSPNEEPMTPITMFRNALGINEGGSGVTLNKKDYLKSVDFWDKHAIVK